MWALCGKHINKGGPFFPLEVATLLQAHAASQARSYAGLFS
jgi:hypothetical protein